MAGRGSAVSSRAPLRRHATTPGVEIATLDPFHGYKNAIDDQLQDARSVLDAFMW